MQESSAYVVSFSKSSLCGTESKALRRSRNTEHTLCLDSSALSQSCVTASKAVTVDFPVWNPHCLLESGLVSLRWVVITLMNVSF